MNEFSKIVETITKVEKPSEGITINPNSPWNLSKEELWKPDFSKIDIKGNNIDHLCSFLPQNDGHWTGKKGDSTWIPDGDVKPECKTPNNRENPDDLTWEEILDKYEIEGIVFKDEFPDFTPISAGEVTIDNFTEDRRKNFEQADETLAKKWTIEKKDDKEWSAEDTKEYRKENNYTWHEHQDCKTMQLVPTEVHNNIPHSGGISEIKKQNHN